MQHIIESIQVNIPFTMLYESYLDYFLKHRLNPEIGLDYVALERFSHADFKDIADRLLHNGLTITLHGPFLDLAPGSPDSAVRALTRRRFEQVLKLVPIFTPKSVVCHAAYDWKRYSYLRDQWVEHSLELWTWFGTHIRNEGGRLMLENVYEYGPEDMRILFENLESQQVGFCLDTGHQAVFSKSTPETWIDSLGAYLGQLHLHDNHGRQDDHLAVGRGNINFEALFNYLKSRVAIQPIVTLEPHHKEDLWPGLDHLAGIWPW
jgi:sugar phosphate isomerase/epimerase